MVIRFDTWLQLPHAALGAFRAGTIVLMLLGLVHLLAVYHGNFIPPATDAERAVDVALRNFTTDMGPFHTTGWHMVQLLSASFSILVLFAASLNWLLMAPAIAAGRLRAMTAVNAVFSALLLAVTVIYRFPPPMVFALVATILFGASFVRQSRPV